MYSRREMLAGLAAGSAVFLAGCNSAEPGDGEQRGRGTATDSGGTRAFQGKLLAPDGESGDGFGGGELSADGTVFVVGLDTKRDRTGTAYVFERREGNWGQATILAPGDPGPIERFGSDTAVSADGSVALVGASFDVNPNGTWRFQGREFGSGSVYVFDREGDAWVEQTKLWANDLEGGETFGEAVAVSADGTVALVGATNTRIENGNEVGTAYVFERRADGWTQRARLVRPARGASDRFGEAVALSADGTVAVVGAPGVNIGDEGFAGAAYVFEWEGTEWVRRSELRSADPMSIDYFGSKVAVSADGTVVLVNNRGDRSASAYQFERGGDGWTQRASLSDPAAVGEDSDVETVSSIALSAAGDRALLGYPGIAADGSRAVGQVSAFDRTDAGWVLRESIRASDGESLDGLGSSIALSADGTTAALSAPGDDNENGENAGAVYVFGL